MASVLEAPKDEGLVRLVVRRPARGQREILAEGQLDTERGLVGDDWVNRPGHESRDAQPLCAGDGHERPGRGARER